MWQKLPVVEFSGIFWESFPPNERSKPSVLQADDGCLLLLPSTSIKAVSWLSCPQPFILFGSRCSERNCSSILQGCNLPVYQTKESLGGRSCCGRQGSVWKRNACAWPRGCHRRWMGVQAEAASPAWLALPVLAGAVCHRCWSLSLWGVSICMRSSVCFVGSGAHRAEN